MNKKIYDPFEKMDKKQLNQMIEADAESRNLKDKKKTDNKNFLHLQKVKQAS